MDVNKSYTRPFLAEGESKRPKNNRTSKERMYVLYCVTTLSVMLLTLSFAATELLSVFFSDIYPERQLLSKLFGAEVNSEKSFYELILGQSFCDLSMGTSIESSDAAPPAESLPLIPPSDTQTGGSVTDPQETQSQLPNDSKTPEVADKAPYIPTGMSPIIGMDLSLSELGMEYIHNTSATSPNMALLGAISLSTDLSGIYPSDAPLVLVLHTHGTESYSDSETPWYDPSTEISRSTDKNTNVVHIGRIIADILNENGISALHCDIMHDKDSYSGSYDKSAETVKRYLARYPSIKYVIDVHRDAVIKSSGELVGAVCETEKGKSAQIMAVVGTGESVGVNFDYMSNLALAQELRKRLNGISPTLARPTCLRPSAYNQNYAAYSVLLEIGTAGNTLEEAELAAEYAANAICGIIKGQ